MDLNLFSIIPHWEVFRKKFIFYSSFTEIKLTYHIILKCLIFNLCGAIITQTVATLKMFIIQMETKLNAKYKSYYAGKQKNGRMKMATQDHGIR